MAERSKDKDLKNENKNLSEEIEKLKTNMREYYSINNELLKIVQNNLTEINILRSSVLQLESSQSNKKYEILDMVSSAMKYFHPKFRSDEETIRLIIEEKKSLGRFGDGEFSIMFHKQRQKFQRVDDKLAQRLREIIDSDNDNLLIGIANHYGSLERFNKETAEGIRIYLTEEIRKQHEDVIDSGKVYSDTYMTRPYVIYKDVFTYGPARRFKALQKIWENKKIIIIEGEQTRLGMGNDLFSNAKSIQRILAPATSSFDRYDEILNAAIENKNKAELFILAVGPSSGVFAYDLSMKGLQAVDVGHIDMEYEWFLAGKGERIFIPNKYNNEIIHDMEVSNEVSEEYLQQIICKFL